MSNKNIAIILATCLCLGALYYLTTKDKPLEQLASSFTSSSIEKTPLNDLDADSLIKTLNSQMLMVSMINPRNIDPVINQFQTIKDKFTKTKLWTKLDLDSMISSQVGVPSEPVAGMPTTPGEFFELVRKEWSGIKEVTLAVSRTTFPIEGPGDSPINFPKMLLALNFSDQATRNRIHDLVASQIPQGQTTLTTEVFTLEKSKENPDRFDVAIQSPFGAPLVGSIEFGTNQGLVTFGTKQIADFFTASSGGAADATPLTDSASWHEAQPSILPKSGSFVYADVKGLAEISKGIQKSLNFGGESDASTFLASDTLNGFGTVGFSSNFADGVKLRGCALIKNSDTASNYRAMLNWAQADKGTDKISSKLISQQTVFAADISGHFLQAYLDNLVAMTKVASFEELQKNGEKYTPELKRMIENYLALSKLLKANPIKNISVVLNAPQTLGMETIMQGSPPVDSNLLIEFRSAMTPANFSKLMNKIVMLFMADSGLAELPSAKVIPAPQGLTGEVIALSSGPTQEMIGAPISESSFLFAKEASSINSAKAQLQQPAPMISEEALSARGLGGLRNSADASWYLSTVSIVQLLHSLAPNALTMAPPEMKLTVEDANELLNLLNVKLYSMQNSSQASEDVYCTELKGIALQ